MDDIDLPPNAPILMESTRSIGYTTEAAIADIIDNSVSANAENIKIKSTYFGTYPFISILDDGEGMTGVELNEAMRYGSSNPLSQREENDLGRFGLGLKTASMSQCRCLTVITKKDNIIEARRWDLDYIKKTQKWSLQVLSMSEYEKLPLFNELAAQNSGTLVIWTELDKLMVGLEPSSQERAFSNKLKSVREHIALVFHRYLEGERDIQKIKMELNGNQIEPYDPFFSKKSLVTQDEEKIRIRDTEVHVGSYVLPHPSTLSKDELEMMGGKNGLKKDQGFYVYRNKRLLVWGTWFNMHRKEDLSKLSRIRVDIPNSLDDLWTLDIKKSTAVPPEIVRKHLKRIVNNNSSHSKRTWTYRGKKETTNELNIWAKIIERDEIRYEINKEHPLVKIISKNREKEDQKLLEQLFDQIGIGIPLNSIYDDLSNDKKFLMDDEDNIVRDAKEKIKQIESLTNLTDEEKNELISTLRETYPYVNYNEFF
ncbi:ATP-binding protein [Methanimicrococcus hongohii]|nr:ATP-binding protein [Methanimicrococcus sp. Hf6]